METLETKLVDGFRYAEQQLTNRITPHLDDLYTALLSSACGRRYGRRCVLRRA
jgi:hypothetical protein